MILTLQGIVDIYFAFGKDEIINVRNNMKELFNNNNDNNNNNNNSNNNDNNNHDDDDDDDDNSSNNNNIYTAYTLHL